jgi:uncharacterized protein (TIGR02996 family)
VATEADFLAAIIADPNDDMPRLIFSDWLDEQGKCVRAEFIRVQCRIAKMPECSGGMPDNGGDPGGWPCRCEYCRLHWSQRELLTDANAAAWFGLPCDAFGHLHPAGCGWFCSRHRDSWFSYRFRRGFVAELKCSAEDCDEHLDAILTRHPVEDVRLTTWVEFFGSYSGDITFRLNGTDKRLHARWPRVKRWHQRSFANESGLRRLSMCITQADFLTPAEFFRGPDLLRPGTLTGLQVDPLTIAFIYTLHPYEGEEADIRVSPENRRLIFWPAAMGHEKVVDREPVLRAMFGADFMEVTRTAACQEGYDTVELRRLAAQKNLFGRYGEVRGLHCLMLWNRCEGWEGMLDSLLVLLRLPADGLVTMRNTDQWWVRTWRDAGLSR